MTDNNFNRHASRLGARFDYHVQSLRLSNGQLHYNYRGQTVQRPYFRLKYALFVDCPPPPPTLRTLWLLQQVLVLQLNAGPSRGGGGRSRVSDEPPRRTAWSTFSMHACSAEGGTLQGSKIVRKIHSTRRSTYSSTM